MRSLATFSTLLVLAAISACDALSPARQPQAEPSLQAGVKEVFDVLTSAKSYGKIVFQGGSLGVEVPKALEHYYTQTGALFVKGTYRAHAEWEDGRRIDCGAT